jgi:hypothetical protein
MALKNKSRHILALSLWTGACVAAAKGTVPGHFKHMPVTLEVLQ